MKTNKKLSAAQQGSKHDNTMNERRRQPSPGQKKGTQKKKNPLADSNYFHIEESMPCINFHACVMLFAYTIHAWSLTVHAICEGLTSIGK